MGLDQSKNRIEAELNLFISQLNDLLLRYDYLVGKADLSKDELKELGEVEYLLLDLNAKISSIKSDLDQHLFGNFLDIYYKLKGEASNGDIKAGMKLTKLKSFFGEVLSSNDYIIWN